jgi:HEXXH motif-containing protein
MDLVPLYRPSTEEVYFAPWRLDARPVGGLIHGVFAFLGVAQTWSRLRASAALRALAEQEFANLREQVDRALGALEESGGLTAHGIRFAAGMRARVDLMRAEPLPRDVVARARRDLAHRESTWRAHNSHLA